MELRIKPFPGNNYPKKGLLIKGSSPLMWLQEMENLGIDLNEIQSFPIPSEIPNVLYGCLLIFKTAAPSEIGRNSYYQSIENKIFIPENTVLYPKINPEDLDNRNAEFIMMHPDFGLVKLTEQIDWIVLIQNPKQADDKIKKPARGVRIPNKIKSFMVEMDDDQVMEALQKPQTEEEWMKNLPFDMKKVMAGNKKEIEKYLKYIERYPERAVELGVPLDVMGTARDDGSGRFKFGSWFDTILGRSADSQDANSGYRNYRWVFWVFMIVIAIARIGFHFSKDEEIDKEVSSKIAVQNNKNRLAENLSFESGITEIDLKIDSVYGEKRRKLMNEYERSAKAFTSEDNVDYQNYLKNGGQPLQEIAADADELNKRTETSKDSLKTVYNKKIVKVISENTEKLQQKITDSLRKERNGIPADQGVVKTVLNKKQILMADSLGKRYGTIEPPVFDRDKNSQVYLEGDQNRSNDSEKVSVSEIFWLIILMTGAVGLYSYLFKRQKINIGGENVPLGIKIFLMAVLIMLLSYIFYPIIEMFGYNWFVLILIICVILLLYRLFREDKTILKSEENE